MNIESLPAEIIVQIFSFLPDVESQAIPNFCSINKKYAEITSRECCWERFIPKVMVPSDMKLKEFVLKHTIGSEKGLVKYVKYLISQLKSDQNVVFQCIFKKQGELYQNKKFKNPSVKLAILLNQSKKNEIDLHSFVFRNDFTPSCIIDETQKKLDVGTIKFSYFTLRSLPLHLDSMFKKIQMEIMFKEIKNSFSEFQKNSNDKIIKAEELFIKEKFPDEYAIFAPRLANISSEYNELHSIVLAKLLELNKNAIDFPDMK